MIERDEIRRHPKLGALVYLTILLTATGIAVGQIAGSGSIQGTITDPSGAVVPQAAVTAVNLATGVETSRLATAAGLLRAVAASGRRVQR